MGLKHLPLHMLFLFHALLLFQSVCGSTEGKTSAKKSADLACLLLIRIEIDTTINTALVGNFSASLFGALAQKFTNINLCVDTCTLGCLQKTHGSVDLHIGYEPGEDSSIYCGSIIVTFTKNREEKNTEHELNQVLTLFQVPAGIDRGGLYMVVAEKIVENVRREVLGEVKVSTLPQGASFTIDSSLGQNKAPKTLLLPPGAYRIEARLPNYLPYRGTITVTAPGETELNIELTKRQFYHSPFMPMIYAFGALTAGAFGCEYYFYRNYSNLNEADYHTRRDEFDRQYHLANAFEKSGYTLLGLTTASFMLTFFF